MSLFLMVTKLYHLYEQFLKAVIFIVLLFEEVRYILTGVIILITIDQITGVWKALFLHNFSWKIFNQVYAKLILYMLALIATFFFEQYILEITNHYFTKGLGSIIGFQELSSTYLNISRITGKQYIEEYLKTIKEKLK